MTGALMAYAPTDAFGSTRLPTLDYRFGRVYGFDQVTAAARWHDAFQFGGKEQFSRSSANIGVGGLQGPYTLAYSAQYIVAVAQASNGALLLFLDPSNFSVIGSFGTADASFANTTTHIEQPNCIVSFRGPAGGISGAADVIMCNAARTNGVINAVTVNGLNNPSLGTIAENNSVLGAKPDGSGSEAWALGHSKLGNDAQISLYKLAPAILLVGHITAAQIDPTWTRIDSVYGITVDQTDGNLIIGVDTLGAATITSYLLKLNSATAAVMWRFDAGTGIAYDGQDSMKMNLVTKGVLYYLDFHSVLWTINTLTGAATSQALANATFVLNRNQASEDVFGSLTWFGSWTEGATHPSYIGYYCGTLGNHSGSSLTWRYFPNGVPTPAPTYGIGAQSRRRAWTFTLDDHVFYVLDLGGQGTYLYDKTTGAWCKWITGDGSTTGFLGWDIVNGTQWERDRIVGGDYISTDIWEMQPAATTDCGGAFPIQHIVTGGLLKRSRVYSSCEAFSLACSVGQLDTNGATVELAFSDDLGKTWTVADETQTLAQGDYDAEITWRSLGSFNSPGRMFRVTDIGGFVRIDGADASIDNFDADVPQNDQQG